MNFDSIIIGGGLSGLVCGIQLAKAGQRVALFSAGQSRLNHASGAFELLGHVETEDLVHPEHAIDSLPEPHLFRKIGTARTLRLMAEAEQLMAEAGVPLTGKKDQNLLRLTPIGELKPAWRVVTGMAYLQSPTELNGRQVLVVELEGFMDAATDLLVQGLKDLGAMCRTAKVSTPAFRARRNNPTEMRAVNMARLLEDEQTLSALIDAIQEASQGEDLILMPAVAGGRDLQIIKQLCTALNGRLQMVPTLPPSAVGTAIQRLLRRRFEALGGYFFNGERITGATIEGLNVQSLQAERLADERLAARHYVLATGSFLSGGLVAESDRVVEPLFDADVFYTTPRNSWFADRLFDPQPYLTFGVQTDAQMHVLQGAKALNNLYAAGSVLGGHNPLTMLDAEGWDIVSALTVAENILK